MRLGFIIGVILVSVALVLTMVLVIYSMDSAAEEEERDAVVNVAVGEDSKPTYCGANDSLVGILPGRSAPIMSELEANPTLKCLGDSLVGGCTEINGSINVRNMGMVGYNIMGGSVDNCSVKISFGQVPLDTPLGDYYSDFSNKYVECSLSLTDIAEDSPEFLAYKVYDIIFEKAKSGDDVGCSGTGIRTVSSLKQEAIGDVANIVDSGDSVEPLAPNA